MLNVFVTKEFETRYKKLPSLVKKKAEKQERLFRQNPFYPPLHTEKLEPRGKQVWSFRVDRRHRILFRFVDKDSVVFLTVGRHDWIYKVGFK